MTRGRSCGASSQAVTGTLIVAASEPGEMKCERTPEGTSVTVTSRLSASIVASEGKYSAVLLATEGLAERIRRTGLDCSPTG